MSGYSLLQYLHILLFVYWLGADLGVFLASRYVARADLPVTERLRFLELLLRLDMGPRTALILMVPVGATLAVQLGLAPFATGLLPVIWVLALLWLALTWRLFVTGRKLRTQSLARLDHWVRVTVAALFLSLGAVSLMESGPVTAGWLALKLLLYAIVVVIGLLLRRVLFDWAQGFGILTDASAGEAAIARANLAIHEAYRRAMPLAYSLWLLVALIALLGVAKPGWP